MVGNRALWLVLGRESCRRPAVRTLFQIHCGDVIGPSAGGLSPPEKRSLMTGEGTSGVEEKVGRWEEKSRGRREEDIAKPRQKRSECN